MSNELGGQGRARQVGVLLFDLNLLPPKTQRGGLGFVLQGLFVCLFVAFFLNMPQSIEKTKYRRQCV